MTTRRLNQANTEIDKPDPMLSDALQELPSHSPPPALWSSIRAELDQRQQARRQRRSTWISSSVAAAAVLAVLLALVQQPDLAPTPELRPMVESGETESGQTMPSADSKLIQARQLSALLESQLRQNTLGAVNAASMDSLLYLENELGWLDIRLASQPDDLDLWQKRIELLSEMNRQYGQNSWQNDVRFTSI